MTQLPATTEPTTETSIALRPAAGTRAGDVLVATYRNRLDCSGGHGVPAAIRADHVPTPSDRAVMVDRLAALRAGLTDGEDPQAGQEGKRKMMLALLSAFPTYGASADGARAMAGLYVRALAGLPTWAVQEAAARFLSAKTLIPWAGDRCPTPPQVAAEARRLLDEIHVEIAAIAEVLDAVPYQPISDADRQRVLADIAAAPNSLLAAGREPRLTAPPTDAGRSASDIVAPLRSLDVSHLMANLDRKRVSA